MATTPRFRNRAEAECDLLAQLQQLEEQTMQSTTDTALVAAVCNIAYKVNGRARDYDPLMNLVDDARFALLGEASHGTHEFYRERAQITKRLIEEKVRPDLRPKMPNPKI